MAHYHPTDELLMHYSAGQQPDALGVMVACHLENCPHCRQQVALYDKLGGELLQQAQANKLSEDLLDNVLMKLDAPICENTPRPKAIAGIPAALSRFIHQPLEQLPWRGLSKSIQEVSLDCSDSRYKAKLYQIAAGKELPVHTHRGNEFTLVLCGSFSDQAGHYHTGDFIQTDPTVIHQPKAAEDGPCICFAVLDAPLKFTGLFGRMLNPFLS